MPSRLTTFQSYPWTGGLVTSIDESLIQPGQLTKAENVVFSTQGTRLKRDGIDSDWDNLAIVSVNRASSGTARTVTTTGYKWTVGDQFYTSGSANTNYNSGSVIATVSAVTSTNKSTVTISNASPGVVTWTAHGLSNNDEIILTTTGALPSPLIAGQLYFVRNVATDTFELSTTVGGSSINTTTAGSGTHTAREALEDVMTYTFTGAGSLAEGTTADTAIVITLATRILAMIDYWYGSTSTRTQKLMAFTSSGRLLEINPSNGNRTFISDAGTEYTIPAGGLLRASMVVFENRLIIATEGANNTMKHYFPTAMSGDGVMYDVTNTTNYAATPKPSMLQVHVGRLFCNDKANPERVHYCETGTYNVWQGAGDSGAFDIGIGDGDPEGVTAIMPSFKGLLFIAKRTKLYKVSGSYPEEFSRELMTSALGCVAHQAVASIDQEDIIYVSDKGVHSIAATDAYGDVAGAYISSDIQRSIVETWSRSRQKYIQAAYLPQLNSVAFGVAEEEDTDQQDIWLYNTALKQWYKWPSIYCSSIVVSNDSDKQRFYFGRNDGRISKALNDENSDTSVSGTSTAINMIITTGLIHPDGNPLTHKAFKKLAIIYKPTGSYTITAAFKIDNFSSQSIVYNDSSGQDALGEAFFLNQSVLGLSQVTAAFTQQIDGYGRGFKLTINQAGVNEFGEILGFVVFYEPTEPSQETRSSDDE